LRWSLVGFHGEEDESVLFFIIFEFYNLSDHFHIK